MLFLVMQCIRCVFEAYHAMYKPLCIEHCPSYNHRNLQHNSSVVRSAVINEMAHHSSIVAVASSLGCVHAPGGTASSAAATACDCCRAVSKAAAAASETLLLLLVLLLVLLLLLLLVLLLCELLCRQRK
jgi:hypothetical protein